jgi:hypothetical protein
MGQGLGPVAAASCSRLLPGPLTALLLAPAAAAASGRVVVVVMVAERAATAAALQRLAGVAAGAQVLRRNVR